MKDTLERYFVVVQHFVDGLICIEASFRTKGLGFLSQSYHTYCSKPPSGTHIPNHRPMIPSGGHVWLFEASFLALDG
jgi:hypothetical protein